MSEPTWPRDCEACRFWRQIGMTNGECRRFPPRIIRDIGHLWPSTRASDWCGEFRRRIVAPAHRETEPA